MATRSFANRRVRILPASRKLPLSQSIFVQLYSRERLRWSLLFRLLRQRLYEYGPGGGGRTHTALRPPDFESGASASSATPGQYLKIAWRSLALKTPYAAVAGHDPIFG